MSAYVNNNGVLIPVDAYSIKAGNRAHIYGDGLFESIRVVNGYVINLENHIKRLKEGMKVERKEAQEFYDQYKVTFSMLMKYLEDVKAYAWKHGHTLTLLGRRREVPLLKSPLPFLRAQGERIAINAPVQGTSADILKLAMIDSHEYIIKNKLENKVKLALQIHDELVFEIDKEVAEKVADDLVKVLEGVLKKRKLADLPLVASRSLGINLQAI